MDEFDEMDKYVDLTDENGNESRYEFLDLIEYEGKDYAVLLPDDESAEVVMLLECIVGEDGAEEYQSVTDAAVNDAVFELFKKANQDKFNFTD